ncbi:MULTISPECIES: SAM-dependent methyltransferase [Protofrankia]|uniref:Translation initiation factor IF-2 n=1 Tax=Protofrankia coriariae TaxID=1562887 RepID=A0ABR5F694_9ACTN|nr:MULTISPECIES: SAM-dependent methyltransferase [Protofrankia]KLL12248.1 translation initiation factor IF-2 [Protofrankia coriariae]ONH37823.1 translation initiation factor IF-2 [Protofrankia sp. BMG5.30]
MGLDAADEEQPPANLNPDIPHVARIYDYLLGGRNNYAADRAVGEQIIAAVPDARASVLANRAFLSRSVHHLAAEAGIRQFLDIGTGLPSANNTHEVAQRAAPTTRVVYVDNDPIVLVHAKALLTSSPQGTTTYIEADLRNPDIILKKAATTLDLTQPVGLMLVAILHCVTDEDNPYEIVTTLLNAIPPGSHLILSHLASDIIPEEMRGLEKSVNESESENVTLRSHKQVLRFFDGLELLEPGLVPTTQWRPEPGADTTPMPVWAGLARKP